jgi:hypothetical protein
MSQSKIASEGVRHCLLQSILPTYLNRHTTNSTSLMKKYRVKIVNKRMNIMIQSIYHYIAAKLAVFHYKHFLKHATIN